MYVPYSYSANSPWSGKTLTNNNFRVLERKNVGEFTIANNIIRYLSESGIWLGKILVNDIRFTKFATKFSPPEFCAIL